MTLFFVLICEGTNTFETGCCFFAAVQYQMLPSWCMTLAVALLTCGSAELQHPWS
jgi:hypothetical protein